MRTRILGGCLPLALALAAVGCKPDYPNCRNDQDCRTDPKEYCVNGKCQQCRNDQDCPSGQKCNEGRCENAQPACTDDSQCPAGQSCIDGHCAPCASDNQCGPGGKCQGGRCQRAKKCSKDDDCAQDEECKGGVCVSGRNRMQSGPVGCQNDPVYFDFNESAITTEGAATLQRNADCLKKNNKGATLIGHTDPRGTDEYNLALSWKRAETVKSYLANLGVKSELKTEGRGEIDAKGTDESGWAKDRRVDFEWR
jgi:peptidoglycan-associated lipoprotein